MLFDLSDDEREQIGLAKALGHAQTLTESPFPIMYLRVLHLLRP